MNHFPAAMTIRASRLQDMLEAIEAWQHSTGKKRRWWRQEALWQLAQWRRHYRRPLRGTKQ